MQITDYPSFLNIEIGMPLTVLVSTVFNFLLGATGLTALVMIIWGGVKYLTSAGDPSKNKDAKEQVFAAILGLIIMFSSWIILNSINPDLVKIRNPASVPAPIVVRPETPIKPPSEPTASFFNIPLGQIIDNVVSQEKITIPKMKDFANSATECSRDLCEGGECEYWVSEPCPEDIEPETPTEPPADSPPSDAPSDGGFDWGDWFWMLKIPSVYAEGDCGYWATCSAPCNTGDPCSADRSEVIDEVLTLADKMEKEIAKLQQGKEKIGSCVLQKNTILLSCQEVQDLFKPTKDEKPLAQWTTVKDCRQGYDFYCMYGSDENAFLDEIILPFETIKKAIESVRKLERVVSSCSCSNCSFSCGGCSGACSGTPCPAQTYSLLADAIGAANELETRLNKLEETVAEIAGLSTADEIITLTCSEAYSRLKSIKESGCPGAKIFPCCPIDQETEKIIRSCRGTDFFFCSAP